MSNDILPCPFCGDTNTMVVHSTVGNEAVAHHVECWECDAMSKMCEKEIEAIEKWNRRTQSAPAIPADVAAIIREALDDSQLYTNVLERVADAEKAEWRAKCQAALRWLDSYAK